MISIFCMALCFRSVKDLARLSLTEPVFVSVHEHSIQSTPVQLQQVSMFVSPARACTNPLHFFK